MRTEEEGGTDYREEAYERRIGKSGGRKGHMRGGPKGLKGRKG
jgi:hypothetical protein